MPAKIELTTKNAIVDSWTSFAEYRSSTESHKFHGRVLNESDVRAVLEKLLTDVLSFDPSQIDREPDFADFLILYRGMKVAVIETKDWGAFRSKEKLDKALLQASTYAERHHIQSVMAFDAETFALGKYTGDSVEVLLEVKVNTLEPNGDLFYFTYYGLSKLNKQSIRSIDCAKNEVASAIVDRSEYKPHHGILLHHTCYAYVGDLRAKKTWKLPYRNPDGTVDTKRIDKAVSYLFKPGGYRGATAKESTIPEAAQPEVARKLALAYREIKKWGPDVSSASAKVLWNYLSSRGETDLK